MVPMLTCGLLRSKTVAYGLIELAKRVLWRSSEVGWRGLRWACCRIMARPERRRVDERMVMVDWESAEGEERGERLLLLMGCEIGVAK